MSRLGKELLKLLLTIVDSVQASQIQFTNLFHTISVNGVSSLVDIETCFNQLRISELDLPITPESTIKSVLTELYKLQEDLQIHLQGGPLADPSTLGTQRRKKVADLLERVMKEVALYEEFVNRGSYYCYKDVQYSLSKLTSYLI